MLSKNGIGVKLFIAFSGGFMVWSQLGKHDAIAYYQSICISLFIFSAYFLHKNFRIAFLIAIVSSFMAPFVFTFNSLLILAFIALLVIAYNFPIPILFFQNPLRSFSFVKTGIILFSWFSILFVIPFFETTENTININWCWISHVALLITLLCLLSDYQDIAIDKASKHDTVIQKLGKYDLYLILLLFGIQFIYNLHSPIWILGLSILSISLFQIWIRNTNFPFDFLLITVYDFSKFDVSFTFW